MGRVFRVTWRLDSDGGGTADVWVDHRSHIDDHHYVFESLDELPPEIGAAIVQDGRASGEIPELSQDSEE